MTNGHVEPVRHDRGPILTDSGDHHRRAWLNQSMHEPDWVWFEDARHAVTRYHRARSLPTLRAVTRSRGRYVRSSRFADPVNPGRQAGAAEASRLRQPRR